MEKRRQAFMTLPYSQLRDLLGLPDDARIMRVIDTAAVQTTDVIAILVEHEKLPEFWEGDSLPYYDLDALKRCIKGVLKQ